MPLAEVAVPVVQVAVAVEEPVVLELQTKVMQAEMAALVILQEPEEAAVLLKLETRMLFVMAEMVLQFLLLAHL
jgi:hypothetical protein